VVDLIDHLLKSIIMLGKSTLGINRI
jgi:hypothetical protein